MAKQRVLSRQGETHRLDRALNVSTGQATEPVADWGLAQLHQGRSGIDAARERRRHCSCSPMPEAPPVTRADKPGFSSIPPEPLAGRSWVAEEATLGKSPPKWDEANGQGRRSEYSTLVRGAACGPADLSRSWMRTDDGNEGAVLRLRTAVCPPWPARSPRVHLPRHELFFLWMMIFSVKSDPRDGFECWPRLVHPKTYFRHIESCGTCMNH